MNRKEIEDRIEAKSEHIRDVLKASGADSCMCVANFTEESMPGAALTAVVLNGNKLRIIGSIAEVMKKNSQVLDIIAAAFITYATSVKKDYTMEEILDLAKIKMEES